MSKGLKRLLLMLSLCCWTDPASADYTLVLKNGGRITVQSYREEGSMIKIQGLGGEMGIPKDQIQTILKAGETERQGLSISDLEASRPTPAPAQKPSPERSGDSAETLGSEEAKGTVNAEEAKEYQKRLAEITIKLEAANQAYFNATQGGSSSSNVSNLGFMRWAADFGSRIRDSQKVPGGGPPEDTPPMPPYAPTYTPGEKLISDLRVQVDALQKERNALIEEMKSKNIPTGIF
jgi:hypothetical protein